MVNLVRFLYEVVGIVHVYGYYWGQRRIAVDDKALLVASPFFPVHIQRINRYSISKIESSAKLMAMPSENI